MIVLFADARGSQQSRGEAWTEMRSNVLDTFAPLWLKDVYRQVARHLRHFPGETRHVGAEIGLGQENHRRGAAFARHQQVPAPAGAH